MAISLTVGSTVLFELSVCTCMLYACDVGIIETHRKIHYKKSVNTRFLFPVQFSGQGGLTFDPQIVPVNHPVEATVADVTLSSI